MSDVPMTHGLDTSSLDPVARAIVEALNERLYQLVEIVIELEHRVLLVESCFESGECQA
jgi:hypothetical protein